MQHVFGARQLVTYVVLSSNLILMITITSFLI